MSAETERKFLLRRLPADIMPDKTYEISQYYLSFSPEIRVRMKNGKCVMTVKGRGDLTREETEFSVPESVYSDLLNMRKGGVITKTRSVFPYRGLYIECDVYHGALEGLAAAEVEFSSEEEARAFIAPEWFGREITYDRRFKNRNLATCPEKVADAFSCGQ